MFKPLDIPSRKGAGHAAKRASHRAAGVEEGPSARVDAIDDDAQGRRGYDDQAGGKQRSTQPAANTTPARVRAGT